RLALQTRHSRSRTSSKDKAQSFPSSISILCALAALRLFSIELRLSLLDESRHAFREIARTRTARERLHLGVELRRKRLVVGLVDELLDLGERGGRALREAARDRLRLRRETVGSHDPVDEPQAMGLGRVESIGQQDQLER